MRIAILIAVVVGVIILGDLAFNDGLFARGVQRAFVRMMMGN